MISKAKKQASRCRKSNKTEKVQSKTASQVCDKENTICMHDKGCKSLIFLNFVLNKFFWIIFKNMFEIKFDKRQNL